MKKILLLLFACIAISAGVQAQLVTGVSLNHDTITLAIGQDTTLVVVVDVASEDGANKNVTWFIGGDPNDPKVVEIEEDAEDNAKYKVKAIDIGEAKEGEAKIVVNTEDGNFKDTCIIKVIRLVEEVELNETSMTITLGRDSVLKALISPLNVTNNSIIWISRDPSIVNITSAEENKYDTVCYINAVKVGKTFIVAESVDGGFKDSCEVTVVTAQIETFTLNYDSVDLIVGGDVEIIAQIRPLEGVLHTVSWTTDDPYSRVVSISSGFDTVVTVTAKGAGQAKLIATAYDGKRDTCVITVRGPITKISLNKDSLQLNLGADTLVLSATLTPSFVIDGTIDWTSSHPAIVDITSPLEIENDTVCQIKALSPGIATIFAVSSIDGSVKDSCVVTVVVPIDSVVIRSENMVITGDDKRVPMNLKDDNVAVLIAKVYPESATDKSLVWNNFDTNLAVIDSVPAIHNDTICYIRALRSGVDTITVTWADGTESSDFYFIDIAPREVDSVLISKDATIVNDTLTLNVKEFFEVITTVYPLNATNDSIILISDSPEIVSIDSASNSVFIRAMKEGEAIIFATPADGLGGKKDSVIVKVSTISVEGISLNKDTVHIYEGETEEVIARITPLNATNDTLVWSVSDAIEATSPLKGVDSVFTFKALKADTAYVYVETKDLGFKDSVVVIIKEQLIVAEMVANGDVVIRLDVAAGEPLTGSFEAHFPRGFGLALAGSPLDEDRGYQAKLLGSFETTSEMIIEERNDGVFIFEINPKVTTSSVELRSGSELPVISIPYTIFDNTLAGSTETFNLKLKNVVFSTVSGDEFIEDEIIIEITPHINSTGNDIIGNGSSVSAYVTDNRLYVDSDKAETIYVYSLNGSLIYKKDKAEGLAVFDIDTQEKVLIVRGSSGWVGKVANK